MGSHARLYAIAKHYLENGDTVAVGLLDDMTPPKNDECDLTTEHARFEILSMGAPSCSRPSPRLATRKWLAAHFKYPPLHGLTAWERCLWRLYGHDALLQSSPFRNVQHVRQWLAAKRPDVVMLVYVQTAYLIPVIRASRHKPKLIMLDTIDVQSRRNASFQARGLSHWIEIDEASELQLADQADIVIAIQDEEARFFRERLRMAETQVLYHSQKLMPCPSIDNAMNVLFVGGGMLPNQMGIQRFIRECWPFIIEKTQGAARLRIVGKVCNGLSIPDHIAGVTLAGFANDLDAEYRDATVVIAPIDFGGGLKIKVVDALCHSKAVVTTPCGAEGLPTASPPAFLIAESSDSMAKAVVDLLLQPESRRTLETLAATYSHAHFDEHACFEALDRRIQHGIQSPHPARPNYIPQFPIKRPIALLFGTGEGGRNGYHYLKTLYRIIGFCDNNKAKQGTRFCGLTVYAPAELKTLDFDRIVICSMHKDAIIHQLQSDCGVPAHQIEELDAGVRRCRDKSLHRIIARMLRPHSGCISAS